MVFEIDDPDGIVAEFGDEEPASSQVDGEVINAPLDVTKGDLFLKDEFGNCCRRFGVDGQNKRNLGVNPVTVPHPSPAD